MPVPCYRDASSKSATRPAALLLAAFFVLSGAGAGAGLHDGTANGEWRYWGGDEASSRYSPLDLINADNFASLSIAWRWKADNFGPEVDYILRATPLYVNGKLYAVAGQRRSVVSIDPATGETLWMWRMKENPRWQKSTRKNYGKGVAWASVDGRDVIYVITPGYYMAALDAASGRPIPGFGINGMVDLHLGLGDYPVHPDRGIGDAGDITSSSPPIVVNGVIVVGNSHDRGYYPDSAENVPGHIRGYDAATGEMLWRFDVVPKPLLWRRPAGGQPVRHQHPRARRQDRRAPLALPDGAPRRVESRQPQRPETHRREDGPAHRAHGGGNHQAGLGLCVQPRDR